MKRSIVTLYEKERSYFKIIENKRKPKKKKKLKTKKLRNNKKLRNFKNKNKNKKLKIFKKKPSYENSNRERKDVVMVNQGAKLPRGLFYKFYAAYLFYQKQQIVNK